MPKPGLSMFSRKIIRDIDDLIVVTDASRRGFRTAERIHELVDELGSNIGRIHVIANKVTASNQEELVKLADDLKLNLIGMIPLDHKIEEMDIKGIPLFEIPDDSVCCNRNRENNTKAGALNPGFLLKLYCRNRAGKENRVLAISSLNIQIKTSNEQDYYCPNPSFHKGKNLE